MNTIEIESVIKKQLNHFSLGMVSSYVKNSKHNPDLWEEIEKESSKIFSLFSLENVKDQHQIQATRNAYKSLGKDPNRYRPSAEALYRRILKNAPLYQVTTLVDIINLVSLKMGYSIGGFDANKILGKVTLGIGKLNEPFEAIGRGELNVENLPIYRDEIGPIGTPTSDHVRTSIDLNTTQILFIINDFTETTDDLPQTIKLFEELLTKYASGKDFRSWIIDK